MTAHPKLSSFHINMNLSSLISKFSINITSSVKPQTSLQALQENSLENLLPLKIHSEIPQTCSCEKIFVLFLVRKCFEIVVRETLLHRSFRAGKKYLRKV